MSERLLTELTVVLARPRLRGRASADQATHLIAALRRVAVIGDDPAHPPAVRSPDPDDDFLLALAEAQDAHVLVSGDRHLLGVRHPGLRILAPRAFLELLPA